MKNHQMALVVFLVTSLLLVSQANSQGLTAVADDYFITEVCTPGTANPVVCSTTDGKVCAPTIADATVSQCRCKTEDLFKRDTTANKCVLQAKYYDKCGQNNVASPSIKCVPPGSVCKADIATLVGSTSMRCLCPAGHVDVKNPGTVVADNTIYDKICGKVLKSTVINECSACNPGVSVCYALPNALTTPFFSDADELRSGCRCDTSFSGDTCHTVNIDVGCDFVNEKMSVCYVPHANVDATKLTLGVATQLSNKDCTIGGSGTTATALATDFVAGKFTCNAGSFLLTFDMTGCDTKESTTDEYKKVSNVVRITDSGTLDLRVGTQCEMKGTVVTSSQQIETRRGPTNHRGKTLIPGLTIEVKNTIFETLQILVVDKNDLVRFCINLAADDDTYGAVLPVECLVSPFSSLGSPKGQISNTKLYENSCPVTGSSMMFKMVNNDNNYYCTDPMKVPPPVTGKVTYLHCKVKVCLKGTDKELECAQPSCAQRRKKRYTDEEPYDEEELEVGITIRDANAGQASSQDAPTITMTTMGFSVIVALLIALVAVCVGVVILLLFKLRARGNKVDDNVEMTQKQPQRFALPRISRNHMRI